LCGKWELSTRPSTHGANSTSSEISDYSCKSLKRDKM